MRKYSAMLLVCFLIGLGSASAQTTPAFGCNSAESHQFDFWLGKWNVSDGKGVVVGTNEVTKEFDGCVVQEHWVGTAGDKGSSFNGYRKRTNTWHQSWFDNQGSMLQLDGGLVGNAMVMSQRVQTAHGAVVDRISWTPLPDGRVHQYWDRSMDEGKTWSPQFDGYYSKAP